MSSWDNQLQHVAAHRLVVLVVMARMIELINGGQGGREVIKTLATQNNYIMHIILLKYFRLVVWVECTIINARISESYYSY